MKIGIVSKFGEQDGIAMYSDSLAGSLRDENAEIVTIGSKRSKSDHRINLKSLFLKAELGKIAKKESLDLLHIQYIAERSYYGMHTLNLNLLDALRQKIPVAVTMHEVHITPKGIKQRIIKKLEEAVVRKAGWVIVQTGRQKGFIEKAYGCSRSSMIPRGASLHPMHSRRGKNLLFFGALSEPRGVEHLIKAMGLLQGYSLTICGKASSGKYAEKLAAEVQKAGNRNIKLSLGWVPEEEKHRLMQESDIIVLPYTHSPFQSTVLHDAVSFGLPAVVTRSGSFYHIVEEYKMGAIAEPGNPQSLAQAIQEADTSYRQFQAGITDYRKEASWGVVAKKHIQVYQEML